MACIPAGEESESDEELYMGGFAPSFDRGNADSLWQDVSTIPVSKTQHMQGDDVNATDGSVYFASGLSQEDLRQAAVRGEIQTLQNCLVQGFEVDAKFSGKWTALMFAAKAGQVEAVKVLLAAGADVNYHADKVTPLLAACCTSCSLPENQVLDCVTALLDAGANLKVSDRRHQTGLMFAAMEGRVGVVKLLLERGAEIDRQDNKGWTALSWAVSRRQKTVIRVLAGAGADQSKRHADGSVLEDLALDFDPEELKKLLRCSTEQEVDPLLRPLQAAGDAGQDPSSSMFSLDYGGGSRTVGELELFLQGLKLGALVPLFEQHCIQFTTFLTLTEDDLIKMGIDRVGVRKSILEGIRSVHKKDWNKESLVPFQSNRAISCADALAMVANLSKHLGYIGSTVEYVRQQLQQQPNLLKDSTDGTGPKQLSCHALDALRMTERLAWELEKLNHRLARELSRSDLDPPDLVRHKYGKRWSWRKKWLGLSMGAALVLVAVWKHSTITSLLQTLRSSHPSNS